MKANDKFNIKNIRQMDNVEKKFWTIKGFEVDEWWTTKKEALKERKWIMADMGYTSEDIKDPEIMKVVQYWYGPYEFGEMVPVRPV